MNEKVFAVVVTYNRKVLLTECLDALLNQTRPVNTIIIIDNASKDGTREHLEKNGYLDHRIIDYVRKPENSGGAGGFNAGIARALASDAQLIWMMDDDGRPDHDCLENLIPFTDAYQFLGPLVVADQETGELSFGIYDESLRQSLNTIGDVKKKFPQGIIPDQCSPFNGVMLRADMVKQIGNVHPDMFIWGDEVEYFLRAKSKNYKIATITHAIHNHPKGKVKVHHFFLGRCKVEYQDSKLHDYCYFRNYSYMNKKYNKHRLLLTFLAYSWFFLVTRKCDILAYLFYMSASRDGLFERWNNHGRFLSV
jgi:rhamnopyranosyl-N-acetylglucosaminyl-diphospho-decaprenol beta-1,3/1,4-galactofuranosyltransferase